MTTESPPSNGNGLATYERFMKTVRRACATPEGRATLRQGLADNLENPWPMYVHLVPAGGIPVREDTSHHVLRQAERPFLLVAALWAVHDAPNPRAGDKPLTVKEPAPAKPWENLGWSLARAARAGMRRETATGLLSYLCELDYDALMAELPSTISLLRSSSVPVKWPVLLRDSIRYQRWAPDVRIDWARSYTTPAGSKETSK
ncbi:type I-E CRISPR-associated protein Cse2/CasB [Streptomyces sp. Go40/10]|uniref:type I-E CRISPR-associated protein Cse2/CasB n=1 Tax=Streptomyces sp. Go40/10 TaxID=2825844 RepID=UPI001E3CAE53|nr:type I-E CRISPR-associated protein Cse2/CasB [Streptomyces sp. Go40/10]UFR07101.1 type I-E CRISPR-associated protein Cse2/CasB [Streptomyces sp. Go40/10]